MPSAVAAEMVPPEPLLLAPPSPVTVKLPLTLVSLIPLAALLLADTLVSDTASGVAPLALVISTAVLPLVVMVPVGTVVVLVLSVASNPFWFASGVIVSAPNVIVPVLVSRLIPAPPDPVELVAAKLKYSSLVDPDHPGIDPW